jgi:pullulanase/glycogen debranching enzyme
MSGPLFAQIQGAGHYQTNKLMNSETKIARSFPWGATMVEEGVNFSLFSRSAKGVELLSFEKEKRRSSIVRCSI